VADEFSWAPFSIFDGRSGAWQRRKQEWLRLGIQSELGRGENLQGMSDTIRVPDPVARKRLLAARRDPNGTTHIAMASGTSIFDPVLAEIIYGSFCPAGGRVLDPFSGGSVRGIVCSVLGMKYVGIDLSKRQVRANERQSARICREPYPAFIVGDARDILSLYRGPGVDLIFSCPPYADLERYSDDPRDLSMLTYREFDRAH
jgi:hypothetical protein